MKTILNEWFFYFHKMKVIRLCVLLCFSSTSYSQNESDWGKLVESAHKIGYCLYNINQQFCDVHIAEYERLVEEASKVEPEEHYFVMREEWAKERVINWAERVSGWENKTKLKVENLLLFFKIPQDTIDEVPIATIETTFAFFVVNLEDDLKFSIKKRHKNVALNCSISHKVEPNMLWNILWREFMSGRLGLLKNNVEFTVFSHSKIRKKFRIFKRFFYRLKEEITSQ